MNKLKRCPFCGNLPRTEANVQQKGGMEDHVDFSIHCTECGTYKTVRLKILTFCNFLDIEKAMEDAAEAWNRRAND